MAAGLLVLHVTHRARPYEVELSPDATLADFQAQLENQTNVPPHMQKLLYKGKKAVSPEDSVQSAGLSNGLKVTLLGNPEKAIEELLGAEKEQKRREEIMKSRAAKARPQVRNTGSTKPATNYKFHRIQSLQHLPSPQRALDLLNRLANDPAIQHVMQEHKFTVGTLTELAPHEHPSLLGLNKNAGEVILLRLRTDAYDGFRLYADIRRVLCHELTHNVWGDHDDNFKALNSKLNREVAEYERHIAMNTHSLLGTGAVYQPSSAGDSDLIPETTAHVLGGSDDGGVSGDTPAARRARVLDATMKRLEAQEKEIEDMCGSAGSGG